MSTTEHSKTPVNSQKTDERRWIDSQKKHVDWIINVHRILFVVLLLELLFDICKYFYKRKSLYNVSSNLIELGKTINCVQGIQIFHIYDMRSAMLVVWTFLSVIVMFFAEHESNRIYGQTVGDLAISVLGKRTDKLLFHAVIELVVLLLSTMFEIPLALFILLLTMPFTAYFAIRFVIYDASSVNLLPLFNNLFKKDIKEDWRSWCRSSNDLQTQTLHWRFLNHFSSMIDNMDLGLSNDYDFVLSIMPQLLYYIMEMKEDIENQSSKLPKGIQWDIPYESVKIMMRGVSESQRIRLGQDMIRILQHPENNVIFKSHAIVNEILAVISLYPIIYVDDSRNPMQDFKDLLFFVKDRHTRTKIIFRAIINNLFLEVSPNIRSLISVQLKLLLSDYDEGDSEIYEDTFHYWWAISQKYPGSMMDASELTRYMNVYLHEILVEDII